MMLPPRDPDDPRNGPILLRPDLLAEGWHDRAIARMLSRKAWVRLRNGAYVPASAWESLTDAERHGLRARAVQRQARTRVVLSHVSGLVEYDTPTWGLDLSDVHVTRLDGRAGRREAGVVQHCGVVEEEDVVCRNGVDVMTATRLALEVTTVTDVEASLAVVNHLLHCGATTRLALEQRYAGMERWPRTLSTDLVLRLADGRAESVGESRCFHFFFRQGFPMPELQHEVRDSSGEVVARVDFAWPELGVYLEFDGKVKYEKHLRPGERASDVVVREKRREEMIYRLTGWRCIRLTWADLERPERTAAWIRAVLFPPLAAA
ncbi:hypothetical protein [Nocardioides dongkuii]|uniref:hypothetical protein n=1 Tax=Nocardioides dongkuii TaxID=2760089 RepID=UPI0015F8E951|nr:hypothetical protein [Nocardioides dongkuii]